MGDLRTNLHSSLAMRPEPRLWIVGQLVYPIMISRDLGHRFRLSTHILSEKIARENGSNETLLNTLQRTSSFGVVVTGSCGAQLSTGTRNMAFGLQSPTIESPSLPSEAGGEGRGEEDLSSTASHPDPLPALRRGARENLMVRVLSCAPNLPHYLFFLSLRRNRRRDDRRHCRGD